mmetsp:Transcript_62791/g.180630  ORF Transcript_62791/g.180630 Transcript_62791/m.180630 type:complete len:269 (-) Transcript_62791:428-1234(-)
MRQRAREVDEGLHLAGQPIQVRHELVAAAARHHLGLDGAAPVEPAILADIGRGEERVVPIQDEHGVRLAGETDLAVAADASGARRHVGGLPRRLLQKGARPAARPLARVGHDEARGGKRLAALDQASIQGHPQRSAAHDLPRRGGAAAAGLGGGGHRVLWGCQALHLLRAGDLREVDAGDDLGAQPLAIATYLSHDGVQWVHLASAAFLFRLRADLLEVVHPSIALELRLDREHGPRHGDLLCARGLQLKDKPTANGIVGNPRSQHRD